MKICTIANGDCFKELGLSVRDDLKDYYGGSVTPTREVFDALKDDADITLLAISYGNRKEVEEVGRHKLLVTPVTYGSASYLTRIWRRIFLNVIPVLKVLMDSQPDYVLSIDGWTYRHLIPLMYCLFASSRILLVITAQYDGCTGDSLFKRLLVKLILLSSRLETTRAIGVRSRSVGAQLIKAGVDSSNLRILNPYFGQYAGEDYIRGMPRSKNSFSILYVGRFVEDKNPEFFVRMASKAIETIGSDRINFTMIGDGPLMPSIREMVSDLGLNKVVSIKGYQSSQETFASLAKSDLLVITSKCESFGKVAVESMIAGTPVIAAAVGGLNDVIVHGENGFLCEPDSLMDFVERIASLSTNDTLYKKMLTATNHHAELWISKDSSFGGLIKELRNAVM